MPRTTSYEIDRYKAQPPTPESGEPMPDVRLDAADAAELDYLLTI